MKDDAAAQIARIREIQVENLPIELCKILKMEGLVHSGGEAKHVIAAGQVTLNGEVETRKRKQIVAGDRIMFAGASLHVTSGGDPESRSVRPQRKRTPDA